MRHCRIVKYTQHVRQRVHLAQRSEHGGILRAVLDHAADIDVFNRGVRDFFWSVELGQLFEAWLRYASHPDMCRRARGLLVQFRARQNFEQSCLSDLRKPDDPSLHRFGIVTYFTRAPSRAHTRAVRGTPHGAMIGAGAVSESSNSEKLAAVRRRRAL